MRKSKSKSKLFAAVAFSLLLASTAAVAAPADGQFTREQVLAGIAERGYTDIRDLKQEGKLWQLVARGKDGKDVMLKIDGDSGQVFGSEGGSRLTTQQVETTLAAAGYRNVQSLAFQDDGMWHLQADNRKGEPVGLTVDGKSGRIVTR